MRSQERQHNPAKPSRALQAGRIGILAIAILLLQSAAALATTVRAVNVFELVQLSNRVFHGRCVAVDTALDPATGLPIAQYKFEVTSGLKGTRTGDTITFRQVTMIAGLPQYHEGQEAVVFLDAESRLGLTSPVGLSQGLFEVTRRDGQIMVSNAAHNRNLSHSLPAGASTRAGLSIEEADALNNSQPIALDLLSSVVRKIDRLHERQGKLR